MALRAWNGITAMDLYEHKASIMWETMRCEDRRGEGYAAKRFDRVGVELESGRVSQLSTDVAEVGFKNIPG